MGWQQETVGYWTWCSKWGIPYPCRKYHSEECCYGVVKVRCYGFFGERWICCGGQEFHDWIGCWGAGSSITQTTECYDSIPSDSKQGCPNTVGDAPPYGAIAGVALVGVMGAVIGYVAVRGNDPIFGTIAGFIVGATFSAGTGRKWGVALTLISLGAALAIGWLRSVGIAR